MEAVEAIENHHTVDVREDNEPRARRPGRSRMFKPAQIAFHGSVLDCVLLDVSPQGAQVHLKAAIDVPELVTLRLPDGETRSVRDCWQKGALFGFETVGSAPLAV